LRLAVCYARGMGWGRACSSLLTAGLGAVLLATAVPAASPDPVVPQLPALQRFLAIDQSVVRQVTTLRHLEARNEHFHAEGWMDVRTEADSTGFRYTVLAEDGSGVVRNKALRATLEHEKRLWTDGETDRSWFTPANYAFEDGGIEPDGLSRVGVTPKRKDLLLVNGSIFLKPSDGELVRIEGTLAKSPSFWTRRVHVVRHYARIAGNHLPIALESTAQIRVAGRSTFSMSYIYESVNGVRIDESQTERRDARPGSPPIVARLAAGL
jgi:hypothetical protein